MPTYEYQCTKGHAFDVFQRISEKPKAKCPECGAKATRVISGGAGLIFKGSGFYITDYGKDGKGPRKAESADSGSSASPSTDATPPAADSKTEPKADSKTDSSAAKPESKKAKPGKAASE